MASDSGSVDNKKEDKEKVITFASEQLSEYLILLSQSLVTLFMNQDVFNALYKFYRTLTFDELFEQMKEYYISKNIEHFNEEALKESLIEVDKILDMYTKISPILKIYQPEDQNLEVGGYYAGGSSETH